MLPSQWYSDDIRVNTPRKYVNPTHSYLIKNLEMKLSSIKKEVEILTELSKGNEEEINNITDILATLNITSPHNNNNSTPKTSQEYEPFPVGRP